MTSHVHLVLSAENGSAGLSAIIRDFKKYTSSELIRAIKTGPESRREWLLRAFSKAGQSNPNNKHYQIWQQDNHPVELLTVKFIVQKLNYVHNNPVHEGIVFWPVDYVFCSATAYAGREAECPLEVDLLEVPLF